MSEPSADWIVSASLYAGTRIDTNGPDHRSMLSALCCLHCAINDMTWITHQRTMTTKLKKARAISQLAVKSPLVDAVSSKPQGTRIESKAPKESMRASKGANTVAGAICPALSNSALGSTAGSSWRL